MIHHLSYQWPENSFIAHEFGMWGALVCGMFFFITGYGLQISYIKKGRLYLQGFFQRRFFKLIYPIAIATIVFQILKIIDGSFDWTSIWENYKNGVPPLPNSWYVYVIIFFYLVFYLIYKISKNEKTNILLFCAITIVYMWIIHLLDWGKYYTASIIALPIGVLFSAWEAKIRPFVHKNLRAVIGITGLASFGLCLYALYGIYVHYVPAWGPLLYWFIPFLTVFACYGTGIPQYQSLKFLGEVSYEIYLVHGAIIYLLCHFTPNPYILSCIAIPISILFAYFLHEICGKIRFAHA